MFQRCTAFCPSVKLRWLVAGFVGTLLVVCYKLSASFDQQLLSYKEFLQHQVYRYFNIYLSIVKI
jgi:hypothetical protein